MRTEILMQDHNCKECMWYDGVCNMCMKVRGKPQQDEDCFDAAMGKETSQQDKELGLKFDLGKDRWDLLDLSFIQGIAKVLTFGAEKYMANSWQHVDNANERYFAALMRHIVAWRGGEKIDKETGLPHLMHAACNLMFLNWFDKEDYRNEPNSE